MNTIIYQKKVIGCIARDKGDKCLITFKRSKNNIIKNYYIYYSIPGHQYDVEYFNNNNINYRLGYDLYLNNPKDISYIFLQLAKYVRINDIDYLLHCSKENNADVKRSSSNKYGISIKKYSVHNKIYRDVYDLSIMNFGIIETIDQHYIIKINI